ncbi:unnamed protein product [Rotaria socialis]|nr:unnamed protein product [Rotaria socialis]
MRLNQFTFDICSIIQPANQIKIPSNGDIQDTFKNFKNNQIISDTNYFPEANECHCHVYSYPYTLTYYHNITNNFPGGLFKYVRQVSLYDEYPFEHDFFLRIAQSFPCMEKLTVFNRKAQTNDNQEWSIIECLHLTELDLVQTHENYVEEFLINTKTRLLNNVTLHVSCESLQGVTHNFTRDATRINCSKIDCIVLYRKPEVFYYSKDYFPNAKVVSL